MAPLQPLSDFEYFSFFSALLSLSKMATCYFTWPFFNVLWFYYFGSFRFWFNVYLHVFLNTDWLCSRLNLFDRFSLSTLVLLSCSRTPSSIIREKVSPTQMVQSHFLFRGPFSPAPAFNMVCQILFDEKSLIWIFGPSYPLGSREQLWDNNRWEHATVLSVFSRWHFVCPEMALS